MDELHVIDIHPIKIEYQNYAHRFLFCLAILVIDDDMDGANDGKTSCFPFALKRKPLRNSISGNKVQNQIQPNFY